MDKGYINESNKITIISSERTIDEIFAIYEAGSRVTKADQFAAWRRN